MPKALELGHCTLYQRKFQEDTTPTDAAVRSYRGMLRTAQAQLISVEHLDHWIRYYELELVRDSARLQALRDLRRRCDA